MFEKQKKSFKFGIRIALRHKYIHEFPIHAIMIPVFPKPITDLPEADVPIRGIKAYLSQGPDHQILFMQFSEDTDVPEHSHESQWGVVLEGRMELTVEMETKEYIKGDRFFIPKDAKHSARIYAGYTSMEFFNQPDRYKEKVK